VERRLAAILSSDVVGYARLMRADEEGTLARLRAHRTELIDPKIAEHRGRSVVDLKIYRHRYLVERFFNKLKYFRRIAARCNKLARNYLAAATLASVRLWMRHI
jgi:transposase